jgi:hypothetical protein
MPECRDEHFGRIGRVDHQLADRPRFAHADETPAASGIGRLPDARPSMRQFPFGARKPACLVPPARRVLTPSYR